MANENARKMRAEMTEAEKRLWFRLRRKQIDGHRFRRQVPLGAYIVDFVCFKTRLVVEIDGGQHDENKAADTARTAWLEREGFRVIRFWNNEVLDNIDAVISEIQAASREDPPPSATG